MSTLLKAIPILPSSDLAATTKFYIENLGFRKVYQNENSYLVTEKDTIRLHFWKSTDKYIAENSGCFIMVNDVDSLYDDCDVKGIVHPNAPLENKPWLIRQFSILDPDGNCITFGQSQWGQ